MVANEPNPTRRTIVIGVDDSDGAAIALRWTDAMVTDRRSRGLDTRAVAVTAWRQPAFDFLGGLSDLDAMEEAASDLLDRCLAKLPSTDNFETATRLGGPTEVLLDEAERLDADLIVVGTRGRGGLAELLLGSVSRSVAARAQRPVAIVPATSTFSDGPIVVGYDGSPGGQAALAWAIDNEEGPILAVSAWHLPTDAIYEPGTVELIPVPSGDCAGGPLCVPSAIVGRGAEISGDGRYIAYATLNNFLDSNDSGDVYLYDRDFDGNGVFDEGGGTANFLVSG